MRSICWGAVLVTAGICSVTILGLVMHETEFMGYSIYVVKGGPAINGISVWGITPFYMALAYISYVATYTIYFSLPLAIALEAYLFLKRRKGEAKENERGNRRQGGQLP